MKQCVAHAVTSITCCNVTMGELYFFLVRIKFDPMSVTGLTRKHSPKEEKKYTHEQNYMLQSIINETIMYEE